MEIVKFEGVIKVIDTGLYGIVRHPMYSATLLLFLSMPIVLGSIYSFFVFLAYPFIIAKRIKHEEEFLEEERVCDIMNINKHQGGYAGGMTPLLDREGKPIISSVLV